MLFVFQNSPGLGLCLICLYIIIIIFILTKINKNNFFNNIYMYIYIINKIKFLFINTVIGFVVIKMVFVFVFLFSYYYIYYWILRKQSLSFVEGYFYVSFYVSFSKKEAGPSASQNGLQSTIFPLPVCAQTLSPSPREDAAKWACPLFLLQKELFCHKRNFSPVSVVGLTFLLCIKTFCCAIKLPVVQ